MAKKKTSKTTDDVASGANFEKELAKLEGIVEKLEGDMPGLDESIRLYEQGVTSLKSCQKTLAGAEARIKMLTDGKSGPELKDFDAEAQEEAEEESEEEAPAPCKRRSERKPRGRGLF